MSRTLQPCTVDKVWLLRKGLDIAVGAGLAEATNDGHIVSTTRNGIDRVLAACALLAAPDRKRLETMAASGSDREEMISWLLAPETRDHALLNKAVFPDRTEIAESRTEMQYDWAQNTLVKEKTTSVLALFAVIALAIGAGTSLEGAGPIHVQGAAGVLAGAASMGVIGWLSRMVIGGLFQTHPSASARGGQSIWRTQIEVLGRLCREGRYTEAERLRIVEGAAAFSSADRLLVQHLGATDFASFMLAGDNERAAMLKSNPPPALNRIAALWQNPDTRLAIGQLGVGKGLLATRLNSVGTRQQAIEILRTAPPHHPSP